MSELERVFSATGARGYVHACELDEADEVGLDSDEPVVLASVFKIPVLAELARQVSAGSLTWTQRVTIPADRRTPGPTGLSVMCDAAELSLRDLAFWMMCVSDNTATDVIMELLGGPDPVNATMAALGLTDIHLVGDCDVLLSELTHQLGLDGLQELAALKDDVLRDCRGLQPDGTNRGTPRAITSLLAMIWNNKVAAPDDCGEIRRIMSLQVWPHRITSGFGDGVLISAKTGTLPGIRNEAGVVQLPDGRRYAVAVFTRADTFEGRRPDIDAAIGRAARLAVDVLSGA